MVKSCSWLLGTFALGCFQNFCLSLQLTHPDLATRKRLHVWIEVALLTPAHTISMSAHILDKTLKLKVLTGWLDCEPGRLDLVALSPLPSVSHMPGWLGDSVSTK